jgi:tetratricopeptide (TPR) repeat protein
MAMTIRAIAQYAALLRLYPEHHWGTNNLVAIYERRGRTAEAIELAKQLAALRPNDYGRPLSRSRPIATKRQSR